MIGEKTSFLVVADFNPFDKAFYEKRGFVQVGKISSLYHEEITEYLMMHKSKKPLHENAAVFKSQNNRLMRFLIHHIAIACDEGSQVHACADQERKAQAVIGQGIIAYQKKGNGHKQGQHARQENTKEGVGF